VIYHLACQKAQLINHTKHNLLFSLFKFLQEKNINVIVLTLTLVSGLFIPESFTNTGNVASSSLFSHCTTAHYTIKMQENVDPNTSAYIPRSMPLHTGTAACCRGSLSDEWPEHHRFWKKLHHKHNLRHTTETNEAAPEMKHMHRCLTKSGPEKASDIFKTARCCIFPWLVFSPLTDTPGHQIFRDPVPCRMQNQEQSC